MSSVVSPLPLVSSVVSPLPLPVSSTVVSGLVSSTVVSVPVSVVPVSVVPVSVVPVSVVPVSVVPVSLPPVSSTAVSVPVSAAGFVSSSSPQATRPVTKTSPPASRSHWGERSLTTTRFFEEERNAFRNMKTP